MSVVLPSARSQWRAFAETTFGVRLVKVSTGSAIAAPARRTLLVSPSTAAAFVAPFLMAQTAEAFVAVLLDVQSRSMTMTPVEITRGLLDQTPVHPRELFRTAIAAGAHTVLVAHNHPSGDPTPSLPDRDLTTLLRQAGDLLGMPVLDHVIIAADGIGGYRYTSFAEAGLL